MSSASSTGLQLLLVATGELALHRWPAIEPAVLPVERRHTARLSERDVYDGCGFVQVATT